MALGVVLALATGFLVFFLLKQTQPVTANAAQLAPTATPLPTKAIPVAKAELAVGQTITNTDIVERQYPVNLVPVGVMTDTKTLVGKKVIEKVGEGEFIRPGQVGQGNDGPLSLQIADKKVAMAFSMEDLLNKSKVIREGDHVDLLLTIDIKQETDTFTREGKATSFTLQNIRVLKIVRDRATEQNPNPAPQAILFEMNPQDVVIAKFVKDSGGSVDFTLRSHDNAEQYTTDAINQDYIFDHYGFKPPVSNTKPKK